MEETNEEKQEGYVPRPASEVWLALVLFIGFVIYQIVAIARGGL